MFGIEKLLFKILERQNKPKEEREEFNIDTKYVHGLLFYNSYFDKISASLSKDTIAFIVGGWIRDRLLNLPIGKKVDIDILVTTDPWQIVKNLKDLLGKGDIFKFEKDTTVASIVFWEGDTRYRFDFSYLDISDIMNSNIDFQEKELKIVERLEENLKDRDFTINAMAILFDDAVGLGASQTILFDPTDGLEDLHEGIVRPVSLENIEKDPVRIIRGYRFGAQLDFELDREFRSWVKKNKNLVKNAPVERVRDEFFKILELEDSSKALRELKRDKVLEVIHPVLGKYTGKFALEILDKFKSFQVEFKPVFLGEFTKMPAYKLAVILTNANREEISNLCRDLAFGDKLCRFLLALVKAVNELKSLSEEKFSQWLYKYKDIKEDAFIVASLLGFEKKVSELKDFYDQVYKTSIVDEPLLSGNEIQNLLNIPPSKEVGKLKESLIEEQLKGRIKTKEEAKNFLLRLFKGK